MASPSRLSLSFSFFFAALVLSSLCAEAREGIFFNKISRTATPAVSSEKSTSPSAAPAPLPGFTRIGNGYGLYGKESFTDTDPDEEGEDEKFVAEELNFVDPNTASRKTKTTTKTPGAAEYYYGTTETNNQKYNNFYGANQYGSSTGTRTPTQYDSQYQTPTGTRTPTYGLSDTRLQENKKYYGANANFGSTQSTTGNEFRSGYGRTVQGHNYNGNYNYASGKNNNYNYGANVNTNNNGKYSYENYNNANSGKKGVEENKYVFDSMQQYYEKMGYQDPNDFVP